MLSLHGRTGQPGAGPFDLNSVAAKHRPEEQLAGVLALMRLQLLVLLKGLRAAFKTAL